MSTPSGLYTRQTGDAPAPWHAAIGAAGAAFNNEMVKFLILPLIGCVGMLTLLVWALQDNAANRGIDRRQYQRNIQRAQIEVAEYEAGLANFPQGQKTAESYVKLVEKKMEAKASLAFWEASLRDLNEREQAEKKP